MEPYHQETGSYIVEGQEALAIRPLDQWAIRRIITAKRIIAELVEYAECNDPGNPHTGRAKAFLEGVRYGSR